MGTRRMASREAEVMSRAGRHEMRPTTELEVLEHALRAMVKRHGVGEVVVSDFPEWNRSVLDRRAVQLLERLEDEERGAGDRSPR